MNVVCFFNEFYCNDLFDHAGFLITLNPVLQSGPNTNTNTEINALRESLFLCKSYFTVSVK